MADGFKKHKHGLHLEPQSGSPTNPVEGDIHFADGTARTEGIYRYDGSAWVLLAEGTAGSFSVLTKTLDYTLTTADDIILMNNTVAKTATLPTAAGNSGKVFEIKKINATTTATVTIDADGTETIDGALTVILYEQYQTVRIVSDGTNWSILKEKSPRTAYIKDVKSSGTNGGTFTLGAWRTRDLNTLSGDTEFITLSANQITLQPGKYEIEALAPAKGVSQHKSKLYNITDSTDTIIGSSMHANTANIGFNLSSITGTLVITASKTFEIQHRSSSTEATNGFGIASGFSVSEIYTQVKIKKVS